MLSFPFQNQNTCGPFRSRTSAFFSVPEYVLTFPFPEHELPAGSANMEAELILPVNPQEKQKI
jgi:hypothetical protein